LIKQKHIVILGSTGSIGRQALEVIRALPERFSVLGLAAGNNLRLLAEQIEEFQPRFVCHQGSGLRARGNIKHVSMEEMAAHPDADVVLVAASGKAGLSPTLAAARVGKKIALSNKECIVMAGGIVTAEVRAHGAEILPVDSEHSAIWQCLRGEKRHAAKILLTASGGPFRGYSAAQMENVTVEQALDHPSWKMGKKVTIDSATLMNKGLEIIEAHWLFGMAYENIEVVVHPQSIIHSMVRFSDGSIKAQLSKPDMRFPIQYALSYPDRIPNPTLPLLDWSKTGSLTFEAPDYYLFPCLKLAKLAGEKGGTFPAALCAADETAVEMFLDRKIKLTDIAKIVEKVLGQHSGIANPTLEQVLLADEWARETAKRLR
jgi:1-deoxy-D-xylulose-5-phosphate reductoisomerase